jgi:hypothetical protein
MLRSPALQALSGSARSVIDRLCLEHLAQGRADNGALMVTHRQFVAFGLSKNAVAPAIREAVALGWISVVKQGIGGNANESRESIFRLTWLPTADAEATNEWMKFKSQAEANTASTAARSAKDPRYAMAKKRPAKALASIATAARGAA